MGKFSQRGAVQLLVPIILVLGLIASVYLVTSGKSLNLFSRAGMPPIVFKTTDGGPLPVNENNVYQTNNPKVKVELTSPLGPPASGSSSISGPIQKGTVSYRAAFDPEELENSDFVPYSSAPTVLDVTFENKSGVQFYWAEFKDSDGKLERHSGKIEVVTRDDSHRRPGEWWRGRWPIPSERIWGRPKNNSPRNSDNDSRDSSSESKSGSGSESESE